jgi:curved DNA-binding protein CbpA
VAYLRTRDWATVDYYGLLGIKSDATDDEIARAFRVLAKQMHPDAGAPIADGERFKEMTLAYEVLSDHRTRRDYDAVRAGYIPRPRSYGETDVAPVPGAPPPRFRAAQPKPGGWTPRRAWISFIGGLLVTLLGIAMSCFVIGLQRHDSARRAGRVAVTASHVLEGGRDRLRFYATGGAVVDVPLPNTVNPGIPGNTERVLYNPRHPTDVIADESYAARDITLWIVAIKLLIGGPVFAILGWRALRRLRRASVT